MPTPQADGMY
jgi:hypothetical protein